MTPEELIRENRRLTEERDRALRLVEGQQMRIHEQMSRIDDLQRRLDEATATSSFEQRMRSLREARFDPAVSGDDRTVGLLVRGSGFVEGVIDDPHALESLVNSSSWDESARSNPLADLRALSEQIRRRALGG